jgi:hypothetical protein
MMDMLEGKDGKKVGAAGLKRKGSEKGSRAAEVSCGLVRTRQKENMRQKLIEMDVVYSDSR